MPSLHFHELAAVVNQHMANSDKARLATLNDRLAANHREREAMNQEIIAIQTRLYGVGVVAAGLSLCRLHGN